MRRVEAKEHAVEAANNKLRMAIRRSREKEENRQKWISYHDDQAHKHLALARQHFAQKRTLVMEGGFKLEA